MAVFPLCVEGHPLFSSLFFLLLQVNFLHESKGFLGSRTPNNQCIIVDNSLRHIHSIICAVTLDPSTSWGQTKMDPLDHY